MVGLGMQFSETVVRFMRTAHFFTPASCFKSAEMYAVCCAQALEAHEPVFDGSRCFHILDTPPLCCSKERLWKQIFEHSRWDLHGNVSQLAVLHQGEEIASCEALAEVHDADLVPWTSALLALSGSQQAPCVAGALADRLRRAPSGEVQVALDLLLDASRQQCPPRRALVALRRNIMLWRRRAPSDNTSLATSVQVLRALEQCRRALGVSPVVHLHVPKTAGISICTWANASGFRSRRFLNADCHVRGDGAFWLGQPAIPASCEKRLRQLSQANASWMSVERWVDLPLCDELQYAVALREPVERTLHHFRHLVDYFLSISANIRNDVDRAGVVSHLYAKLWGLAHVEKDAWHPGELDVAEGLPLSSVAGLADWVRLWQGFASNYQVRSLAGAGNGKAFLEEVPAAPRRLAVAKQVLEQFDAIVVVDKLLEPRQARLMGSLLGAPEHQEVADFPAYSHRHGPDGPMPPADVDYDWGPGELHKLRLLNAADGALVRHAALLQELDQEYLELVAT